MPTFADRARRLRRLVHAVSDRLKWLPPTVARITVGWIFLQSGWGKLHNLPKVVSFFAELGIPAPQFQAPSRPRPSSSAARFSSPGSSRAWPRCR